MLDGLTDKPTPITAKPGPRKLVVTGLAIGGVELVPAIQPYKKLNPGDRLTLSYQIRGGAKVEECYVVTDDFELVEQNC
jgi:hypothetical protein